MAYTTLSNAQTAWYLANRPGSASTGTPGSCLVSDLIAGDYLVGSRCTVVTPGTTTSGNRTLTVDRNGAQHNVVYPAASSLIIIRPAGA